MTKKKELGTYTQPQVKSVSLPLQRFIRYTCGRVSKLRVARAIPSSSFKEPRLRTSGCVWGI